MKEKLIKIGKGAAIAAAGAALAYVSTNLGIVTDDLGPAAAGVAASIVNALYQAFRGATS